MEKGGHLYICGGVGMATGVCRTVKDIIMKETGMDTKDAGNFVENMRVSSFLAKPSLNLL